MAAEHHHPSFRRAITASVVVGVLSLTACGARDAASGPSCLHPAAAFDEPHTRHAFKAPGASRAELDETVRVLCARLAASGIAHRVRLVAGDRVVVQVPRSSPHGDRDALPAVGATGDLAFYDWEANVIGPDARTARRDRRVTDAVATGRPGSLPHYEAVLRAARRPRVIEPDNAMTASRFYAVDPQARRVLSPGPAATRAQALAGIAPARRATAKVYEVSPGTVLVRAERRQGGLRLDERDQWYVLRDDVALGGREIRRPRASRDANGRPSGAAIVTVELTAEGRERWLRLRDRGIRRGPDDGPSRERPKARFRHVAVLLDDQILGFLVVDQRAGAARRPTPDPVVPSRTLDEARRLAAVIAGGPLPTALEPG